MRLKINIIETAAILLIIIIASILFIYGGPKPYPKDKIVVAFGDSLTRGYGVASPGKNFVTYLSEYTKINIINSGKSGDETADALVRLKSDVLDYNPDVVMVLLGGNDYLDGYSEEVFDANMHAIIKAIKKTKAKIILIGGNKYLAPKFELVLEKMAAEDDIAGYVPSVLGGISLRKDLLFDDVHPNDNGHKIIADLILPVLEKVLREL